MCLTKTAALVGPVGLTTLQKETITICATLHKELSRSFRVLVDAGGMISLQRWLLYWWFEGTLGKQVPKQVPRSQDMTPSLSMSL